MARYYPVIKVRAQVEIKVYTKPVPTKDEWVVIFAIFTAFSKWLQSKERGDEGGVRAKVLQNSVMWSFELNTDNARSSEFPNPFSNWIEDEERWDDDGRLVANREEVLQSVKTSIAEHIKKVAEVTEGVEVCIEIHEISLFKNVVRFKD